MKTSEQYVVILIKVMATVALIALILLTSCAPKAKKPDGINPIANAQELGKALSCMFGGCKTVDQKKSQPTDK